MPSKTMDVFIPLLQQHGWDMYAPAGRHRTMLHHDANHGHGARICTWLKYGADPTIKDDNGQTALHILAAKGVGAKAIQALVRAGADINAADDQGNTPFDLACQAPRNVALRELEKLRAATSITRPDS